MFELNTLTFECLFEEYMFNDLCHIQAMTWQTETQECVASENLDQIGNVQV